MDRIETNVDKPWTEREKEGNSDDETEREAREMLEGYNLGMADREGSYHLPS